MFGYHLQHFQVLRSYPVTAHLTCHAQAFENFGRI